MKSRLFTTRKKARRQSRTCRREGSWRRRPQIEALEDRCLLAASPPLLSSIEGYNIDDNAYNSGNTLLAPPDLNGAVGPNHVLNVGNISIQWFTKAGFPQMHTSLQNFFAPLQPQTTNLVFDPKAGYDHFANRYVVLALETSFAGVNMSRILVAVSDDSDPNGTWHYKSINSIVNVPVTTGNVTTNVPCWTDFPGFGFDEEAFYITGNLFEFGTFGSHGPRLWIVDKGLGKGGFYDGGPMAQKIYDPAAATSLPLILGTGATGEPFRTLQPATIYGAAPSGVGTWLSAYDGRNDGTNELIDIIRVDNPLGTPTFTLTTVNVGNLETPDAVAPSFFNAGVEVPQKGSLVDTLDPNDRRTLSTVWRNNSLYVTTEIYPDAGPDINQVTAHWFRFSTTILANVTVADQGDVSGEDIGFSVNTMYPSVVVDAQGNMAIGFSASGPTIYPGAYYAVRAATDPAGTLRDAGVLATGLDVYALGPLARWGDYSGIALDPTDGVTIWVGNEYALPGQALGGRWGTRWGSFRFGTSPPPPPPGPTTITGTVWHDVDESATLDLGEVGLPSYLVYVDLDGDGYLDLTEPTGRSNSRGKYTITFSAAAGSYVVRESLPAGWHQTYPGDPDFSHTVTVTAQGGGTFTLDFGNSDLNGFDHGDAPSPFPTLVANNGPSHAIIPGFMLGASVDGEADGLPETDAKGDDADNVADENGIAFLDPVTPGGAARIRVTASLGGHSPGRLHGWIDFNRDGDWADAGEKVFDGITVGATPVTLTVNVPTGASRGPSFARFRYADEATLSYTGPATGGEVEDYRVDILSSAPVALPDAFTVAQDSVDNRLNVMANDTPSANGIANLQLFRVNAGGAAGTARIDDGGTPTVFTDDVILYTPDPGAFGTDSFSYVIRDVQNGNQSTTTVTITITPFTGDVPVAVDDTYNLASAVGQQSLPVLNNDLPGPTDSIAIVDVGPAGGTVTIAGATLLYTPPALGGTDQFTYTIRDTNNVASTATVTVISPSVDPAELDRVKFILRTTDLQGNAISEIGQGQDFQVRFFVQDVRGLTGYAPLDVLVTDQGVFSAYADLLYNRNLVSFIGGAFWGQDFPSGRNYLAQYPGLIDEAGAFQASHSPLGNTEKLLFVSTYRANTFTVNPDQVRQATFATDPADDLPLHETTLVQPETQVLVNQVELGATSINIVKLLNEVEIRLVATNPDGSSLSGPLVVGQQFLLKALVDDLRNVTTQGVFSAYLDVSYDASLARPVTDTITFGPLFPNAQSGTLAAAGLIDEVGGIQADPALNFTDAQELFEVLFVTQQAGTLRFTTDPADNQPLHEITVFPQEVVPPSQVSYVAGPTLTIGGASGEGEYTNPVNPMDVNDDGFASPVDVLILINFLNQHGPVQLATTQAGGEGEASGRLYYDVNADGRISPSDALGLINYLNARASLGAGEAAASGAPALATAPAGGLAFSVSAVAAASPPVTDAADPASADAVSDPASATATQMGQTVAAQDALDDDDFGLAAILTDDLAEDVLGGWLGQTVAS